MDAKRTTPYKPALLTASGLLLVWGCLGVADVRNQPYTGYQTGRNRTVSNVVGDSPADVAGMEVGDVIRSIGGVATGDLSARARQPRAFPGEERIIEVDRDGELLRLELTYASLPTSRAVTRYGAIVVGIVFLLCGTWAYLTAPGTATALLAVVGVCTSAALGAGPYIEPAVFRNVVGAVGLAAMLMFPAVLLHFLLVFPAAKRMLKGRTWIAAVYGPAGLSALTAVWLWVAPPNRPGILTLFTFVTGLLALAYVGLSIAAVIHSYVTVSRELRSVSGLNLLLLGVVLGFGPPILVSVLPWVVPQLVIPGGRFAFLTFTIVPVAFALAAVRSGRAEASAGLVPAG